MTQVKVCASEAFNRPGSVSDLYPPHRREAPDILSSRMSDARFAWVEREPARALHIRLPAHCGSMPRDAEITVSETPRLNWGIRGKCGDGLSLNYEVKV